MKSPPDSVLSAVLGASAALGSILAAVPCNPAGCAHCLQCAGLGVGAALAAALLRRAGGREAPLDRRADRPDVPRREEKDQDIRNQEESCR